MNPASRTPEGDHRRCSVCGNDVVIEPSRPANDAPCPHCGELLWFDPVDEILREYGIECTGPEEQDEDSKRNSGECYRRGSEAMSKEDWDFATRMYVQCVQLVPDNLMYRQVLRGSQYKRHNDNGVGAAMAPRRIRWIRKRLDKLKAESDWDAVDRLVEEGLWWNPWHTELHFDLGLAGLARGYRDVALFAFECALNSDPDRADIREIVARLQQP